MANRVNKESGRDNLIYWKSAVIRFLSTRAQLFQKYLPFLYFLSWKQCNRVVDNIVIMYLHRLESKVFHDNVYKYKNSMWASNNVYFFTCYRVYCNILISLNKFTQNIYQKSDAAKRWMIYVNKKIYIFTT